MILSYSSVGSNVQAGGVGFSLSLYQSILQGAISVTAMR